MADDHTHEDGVPCRSCGTMKNHRRLLDTDRNYARRLARAEDQAYRAMMRGGANLRPGCTRIPVVVHVVWNTPAQNISKAQIDSQIAILNKDFRKKNPDVSSVPAPFAPLAGDARIEFVLASEDPDGNPTDGVTRTQTTQSSFSSDDGIKSSATGGADAWDTTEYLNIWVGRLSGGLLGYAQFPGGPVDTDGVVCTYTAFGDIGTAQAPFDKGRTATHEIGHWLNLRHIWGDDGQGCSGTDHVADTPNQGGPNTGKPSFPTVSCGNGPDGDMFMNFMDYVDDDTMVMFTEGQITRMQACLDGPRSSIGETIPCGPILKLPGKDTPKEFSKEIIKEHVKDFPKDAAKDFPKDGPKDPKKDFPKEGPKEFPKDGPKEIKKEFIKEFPNDPGPGKSIINDPGKTIVADPQKTIFEPPDKGIYENPDVPGGGFPRPPVFQPVQPMQPMQPMQPAMPFVLSTGMAPGGMAPPQQPQQPSYEEQQAAAMVQHYAMLLASYADLYQRGMLDAQGIEAWNQTYAAYVQLGGQ